ncbi:MAG: permease-like cell division protein FtsX [Bacteroidales bacterium]|nr:permease-like cell division protein FtsX [Bacteroidales bacterium]
MRRNTKKQNKVIRQRMFTSYTSTLISVALVLFVLSLIGLLLTSERALSNHVKEKIGFTLFLKSDVRDADMFELRKSVDAMEMVKQTEFVSAEEASARLAATLGQNYVDLAEGNPIPPSLEVHFYAEYATPENFVLIEQQFKNNELVDSIHYDRSHIQTLNSNIKKISWFLFALSVLLFGVSVVLIHNTIRLSIYSKRFLIKTMQLVGATNHYIRSPFLLRGAFQGFLSGLIAVALTVGILYFLQAGSYEIIKFLDFELLGVVFLAVILIGMFLTFIATFFALNKFLKINKDELYII